MTHCTVGATGEILCSYSGDGSDGFVNPTAPGSSGSPVGIEDPHPLGDWRWDCEVEGTEATMQCTNYGVPHAGNRIIVSVSGEQGHEAGSYEVHIQEHHSILQQLSVFLRVSSQTSVARSTLTTALISHITVLFVMHMTFQELTDETVDSGGFSTYGCMILAFCSHVRQVQSGLVRDAASFANTGLEPFLQMGEMISTPITHVQIDAGVP
jgi:hypothetical protein